MNMNMNVHMNTNTFSHTTLQYYTTLLQTVLSQDSVYRTLLFQGEVII